MAKQLLISFAVCLPMILGVMGAKCNSTTTESLVLDNGYPIETHRVTTYDGYILTMHRIPFSPRRRSPLTGARPVIFLMHGLMGSSSVWVALGPKYALAYLLSDIGYDVWLGNARGNTYSREHVCLDSEPGGDGNYWDFSWHEIGVIDIPATIEYIREQTLAEKVVYVGHSQGGTSFFAVSSLNSNFNKLIESAHMINPAAYMSRSRSSFFKEYAAGLGATKVDDSILDAVGRYECKPTQEFLDDAASKLCKATDPASFLCTNFLFLAAGSDDETVDPSIMNIVLETTPDTVSTKQILHYSQEYISGYFRQFDYGKSGNLNHYDQIEPPNYPIGNIDVPLYLYYSDGDDVVAIEDIFRHGPRTPADTYPKDPHVNETFFPFGWGQLTNNGKRELFNVGSWLRKRYNQYLGPFYMPDYVHAQTTGVTRTYMSMATVLASLFPPKNTPMEWNSKYNWQPIPIMSQPLEEDNLLLVRTPCPRYYEALKEVFQLPEVKAEIEPYESLFKELTELTGLNVTTPEDVQSIYTTLLAETEFGLALPDWTQKYYPQKMQFLAEQSYLYSVYTPEMQKIKAGPFLRKMLIEMKQKRTAELAPKDRKLFIYTGHDTSLVNIFTALGVWERQMPRYSIMALFELHKNKKTGEYHVEIFMRNNPKADAKPLTIPGCDRRCPLDKFIELTRSVVPTEESLSSCSAKDPTFTEPPPSGP